MHDYAKEHMQKVASGYSFDTSEKLVGPQPPTGKEVEREIPEAPMAKALGTFAAAALPAAAMFALARRARLPGDAAALAIREKGLHRMVPRTDREMSTGQSLVDRAKRYLEFGTEHVEPIVDKQPGARPKVIDRPVHSPYPESTAYTQSRTHTIGTGKPKTDLNNKAIEAETLNKHAPGSMPETTRVSELARQGEGGPAELQNALRQRFGDGYVLKEVDGMQTAGNVVTDADDLSRMHAAMSDAAAKGVPFKGTSVPLEDLKMFLEYDPDYAARILHHNPEIAKGLVVERALANPESVIAQAKLKIQPMGKIEQSVSQALDPAKPSGREIRVHAIGERVMPSTTVDRYSPIRQAANILGFRGKRERQAEQLVRDTIRKLPEAEKKNVNFNMDVAVTKDGPKIIETNAGGQSGLLDLPPVGGRMRKAISKGITGIQSHKLVSELQGRDTVALAGAKALATGAAGAGAVGIGRKAKKKREDDALPEA